jgi:hypothetical protein
LHGDSFAAPESDFLNDAVGAFLAGRVVDDERSAFSG